MQKTEAKNIQIIDHAILLEKLKKDFERRMNLNASYSMRAYARDLDVSVANLSKILSSKRPISNKMAKLIIHRLKLEVSDLYLSNSNLKTARHKQHKESLKLLLEMSDFELISEWHYDIIQDLVGISKFDSSSENIADTLNLNHQKVKIALERLEKLGLVKKIKNQWRSATGTQLITNLINENITSESARRYQSQVLDKSQQALNKYDIANRSHSSISLKFSSKNIDQAKELIKNFRQSFRELMEEHESADSVYQIQISFFPHYIKNKGSKHEKES